MDWTERIEWLLLGMFIGYVLGRIVKSQREIKEELDEVKALEQQIVTDHKRFRRKNRKHDEEGATRQQILYNAGLFIVLVMVVYSSFASQKASNEGKDTADCNISFLGGALTSLNDRSTYTVEASQANLKLQTAQAEFFGLLLAQPPLDDRAKRVASVKYFAALNEFVEVTSKSTNDLRQNPYPTVEAYRFCLNN